MKHSYPPGTTPAEHDDLANDYAEESRAVQVIADRLKEKAVSHRRIAEQLRLMYAHQRNEDG
jgi:hypothetical protein